MLGVSTPLQMQYAFRYWYIMEFCVADKPPMGLKTCHQFEPAPAAAMMLRGRK